MVKYTRNIGIVVALVVLFVISVYGYVVLFKPAVNIDSFKENNRVPSMYPDYSNLIIPSNIAPLNFEIGEDGDEFLVKLSSKKGECIKIYSTDKIIDIPGKEWRNLLKHNAGNKIAYEMYCKSSGNDDWYKFNTFYNSISSDSIDPYLAYRLIAPGYILWGDIGIYQRNLENFTEEAVVENSRTGGNCMNCHSFNQQNADNMMFHIRAGHGGTVIIKDGKIKKVNTKIPQIISAGVYPAWHVNGKLIAFSVNKIGQYFHAIAGKSKEVLDFESDIIVYNIETNTISSTPALMDKDNLETFPCWSPDGKYLYYCSASNPSSLQKEKNSSTNQIRFDSIKYSLKRIYYDVDLDKWGEVETLVLAKETKKSVSFPRVSPDNKFVMFSMSEYGTFSINHKSSDLYIYDLEQYSYKKMTINSDETDSFHSWSSNSRWFVFSSKREDGVFARPYICHFDENGSVSKPFILPQKNPQFYSSFLKSYNIPEFINGRININSRDLYRVINSDSVLNAELDSRINTDAFTGETVKVPIQ